MLSRSSCAIRFTPAVLLLVLAAVSPGCSRPQVVLPDIREPIPTATLPAPAAPTVPEPTAAPRASPTPVPTMAAAPSKPSPSVTAVASVQASPAQLVEQVHTRFMTELLEFGNGVDIELAAELTTGAVLTRLLDGIGTLRSKGYESVIVATTELSATEYLVADCSRDRAQPTDPARLRHSRLVDIGGHWRIADFHTAGVPCSSRVDEASGDEAES